MSLSSRVFVGLLLGVAVGIFFGEAAEPLGVLGDAFLLLLQMTVLPFVVVSLIHGLGRIRPEQARGLAVKAGGFLLIFWAVALLLVLLTPAAFPDWPSASFFSRQLVEVRESASLLTLYIPSNPFSALADNTVPATVLFSSALGIAIMGLDRKQALLDSLEVVSDALLRIAAFVAGLAPYGVFAIVAEAAGTMDPAAFAGLQVYIFSYCALALVLTLWVVPVLVTCLSPLRYRDLVVHTRGALLTAFATASLFVVLPVLAARCRELLSREGVAPGDSDPVADVVVPVSFTFPSPAKLLKLIFVLFAGWSTGFTLSASQWGELVLTGPLALFAHPIVAMSFLLDYFRVPQDTIDLFIVADNVLVERFGALLGAVYVLCLAVLSGCALSGTVKVRWNRLVVWALVSVALSVGSLLSVRFAYERVGPPRDTYQIFVDRPALNPGPRLHSSGASLDRYDARPTLQRIREDGVLRAGYVGDGIPYAFRNESGEFVGFDMEMARELAQDLGVRLEIVTLAAQDIVAVLDQGVVDIVMSGFPVEPALLDRIAVSDSYVDETLAFIVRDDVRNEFSSAKTLQGLESPRIAVPDSVPYYADMLRRYLPNAEVVELESPRTFLRGALPDVDAMLYGAEAGSSWCLIYPEFSVVVPLPDIVSVPIAYPLAADDPEMQRFMNRWIELKKKNGTIDAFFDYWFLGKKPPAQRDPRWSIARDVLGWLD